MIVFPRENYKPGQYVNVYIESANKATLKGRVIELADDYIV
jgi:hypothetical protein